MTSYPVLWQQSAVSLRVEYRCKQGRHLGAAGRHQIGLCEMECQAPLPGSTLPPHFVPRVHEPRSLQLSAMGPAPGLCSLCQIHPLLATWQCHSLQHYVWTMARLFYIPAVNLSRPLLLPGNQEELSAPEKNNEQAVKAASWNQISFLQYSWILLLLLAKNTWQING